MSDLFPVHGGCAIRVEDNMMVIDASGPWNMEYFQSLHQALINASKQLNTEHYGVFLSLSGQAIAVDGGLELHSLFVSKSGVKAMALDFSQCETATMSKKLFAKAYGQANVTFQMFDDPKTAKAWLTQFLKKK